jgi:hypothetical protein
MTHHNQTKELTTWFLISIRNFLWCIEHIRPGQKFLSSSKALTLVPGQIYPMHRIYPGLRRAPEALKSDPVGHIQPQLDLSILLYMSNLLLGSRSLAAWSGRTYPIIVGYI